MSVASSTILVTGATGAQGGATAAQLLAKGWRVRILARNPEAAAAQALARSGAQICQGDLGDVASLNRAMDGVQGVFSVQVPSFQNGDDAERRHGFNLVNAARQAGVNHFVHTSVCEAGKHLLFPDWQSDRWGSKYWTDKWDIEEAVRQAGFARWTVLKPAFMMDNYAQPKAAFMFPQLRQGKILTAFLPETRLQLTSADDVGAFARAAFEQPERFNRQNIDIAAEALTMSDVAATLSRVQHRPVVATSVSPVEALAAGLFPGWVRTQEWANVWGYRADIVALAQWGVPLSSFTAWIGRHVADIVIEG
ncbi:MAG: NmrA/HSCARG family protein [Burkholderiaceae bacterium]